MRYARIWLLPAALVSALWLGAGCNKPSEENCRKALSNIRHLLGTEHLSQADQTVEGEVRRCRGGSKRVSVDCAIKATTLDELRACKLIDIPATVTPAAAPAAPTDPAAAPAPTAPAPTPTPAPAAPAQ
jgi:hypothetical protein